MKREGEVSFSLALVPVTQFPAGAIESPTWLLSVRRSNSDTGDISIFFILPASLCVPLRPLRLDLTLLQRAAPATEDGRAQ